MLFLSGCYRNELPVNNVLVLRGNTSSNQSINFSTGMEDLRFPVTAIKTVAGVKEALFVPFINKTIALEFPKKLEKQAFVTAQLPHERIKNSTLYAHFHWTPEDTVSVGYVRWCMDYTFANINDTFPYTTTVCVEDESDGVAYKHQKTDMIVIPNNLTDSAIGQIRIWRDTDDTYFDNVWLHEFDIHYLKLIVENN